MLAVVRADDDSLVPPQAAGLALSVARPLPTETASLGFGGSPAGGGDKTLPFCIFSALLCGGVVSLPSACASCCRNAGRPRVTVAYLPFLCRHSARPVWAEYPRRVHNATPAQNRAHSGSHAETRGESAERRMQGCKVFKSLHPYILAPVNTSTIARRIFLK